MGVYAVTMYDANGKTIESMDIESDTPLDAKGEAQLLGFCKRFINSHCETIKVISIKYN